MPMTIWQDWALLEDQNGPLGFALWRAAADILLWNAADPVDRDRLFSTGIGPDAEALRLAAQDAPAVADAVQNLWTVYQPAETVDAKSISNACYQIARWAEDQNLLGTAAHFAEVAARLQPASAPRAYTAGRLSRRNAQMHRAAIWYNRSRRLARLNGSNIDRANAHLGLGNVELELGRLAEAEKHFVKAGRAAMRNGRKSLAGAAHHALVPPLYEEGKVDAALENLRLASEYYRADHPLFPRLAYDAGFLMLRESYFSSALIMFEAVLPWLQGIHPIEILARSALARCAAAVRDHIRYHRMSEAVLLLVDSNQETAGYALYQLGEGARSFLNWAGAERLARQALESATIRNQYLTIEAANRLLAAIVAREPGDVDRVPSVNDPVELVTHAVLRKLKKRPAPTPGGGAVPPEDYPTD